MYPDDIKLKMITDKMRGNVYYANSDDSFKEIMGLLGQERSLSKIEEYLVSEDKRPFFENLCWNLVKKGSGGAACIVCGGVNDESKGAMLQCEKCGAMYHTLCAKELGTHEGDPLIGIFRCKTCHCLILASSMKKVTMEAISTRPRLDQERKSENDVPPADDEPPASPDDARMKGIENYTAEEYAKELSQTSSSPISIKELPTENASEAIPSSLTHSKPSITKEQQPNDDEIKVISVENITPRKRGKKPTPDKNGTGEYDKIVIKEDQDKAITSNPRGKKKKIDSF